MLFHRSYIWEDDTDRVRNSLLPSGVSVTYKPSSAYQPDNLMARIANGEDPIGIWVQQENDDVLTSVIPIAYRHDRIVNPEFPPKAVSFSSEMTRDEVLYFCEAIGVHPAHLVPFHNDARLSLPKPILEANILIAQANPDKSPFTQEDIDLANVAIATEQKRIAKFTQLVNEGKTSLSPNEQELFRMFNDVCSSFHHIREVIKIRQAQSFMALFASDDDPLDDSVIACVKKVYLSLSDKFRQSSKDILDRKREDVDRAYNEYVCKYRMEMASDSADAFLRKVEATLEEKGVDCRAATIADILAVLHELDPQDSSIAQSYFHLRFGQAGTFGGKDVSFWQEPDNARLMPVAVSIATYFSSETAFTKAKKKHQIHMTKADDEDTKIKAIFSNLSQKPESLLFRNLMDNNLILASAFPATFGRSPKTI